MSYLKLPLLLIALMGGSAHAMVFSSEDFSRYPICSKDFCQTPDRGATFRNECRAQDGVLPPYVYVIYRSDGRCYCPCTLEYRIYREE